MAGPHQRQPLETAGTPLESASVPVVLVHGRGATARSILRMADVLPQDAVAYLAPQAARNTWYPNPFTAPVETNEPGRRSGLQAIEDAVSQSVEAGIPRNRIVLAGFSQGACLVSEFLARTPDQYGGLAALSGGLIGESIEPDAYAGDLDGMPVFLGCSDVDPHIPLERVQKTATVFERLGATVTKRIYEGMGHTVNEDERQFLRDMIDGC